MSNSMIHEIFIASLQTLYMVLFSGAISTLFGLPLGIVLFCTKNKNLTPKPTFHVCLGFIVNTLRSIPFIILLALLIPVTRFIVGSSIGSSATIVPLSIGAIPFFARIIENIFVELPDGLIDAGLSFGASPSQIVWSILLPEALPAIINAVTVTLVTLVSYSAMSGAVGGGGLGALAIDYGYQRFEFPVLVVTVIILVLMVQAFQAAGSNLSKRYTN
jgi:D-methionine transport system permease protein